MKKTLLFLALILSVSLTAQHDEAYVDALTADFTTKLQSRGIDSYFVAQRYCLGTIEMFTLDDGSMCSSRGTYYENYVVWREDDGTSMIKKIDNCGMYFSLPLPNPELYTTFETKTSQLREESVEPYEVANPENNPIASTEVHPCRREYTFVEAGSSFSKSYRLYDLTNDSSQRNLNFEANNATTIVAMDTMLDNAISSMSSQMKRQN